MTVVPSKPANTWRFASVERAGVKWYWDQVALWWPGTEMLDYYRLGLPNNRPVLRHALKLRDFYISMLTEEQKTDDVDTSWRDNWPRLHAEMLTNGKNLAEAKKRNKRQWIWAWAIVGTIALGMAGCTALVNSAGSADGGELAQVTAQNLCEGMVTKQLRSPSTAKFSSENAIGSNPIIVTGYVDSENGFGAMLRASFHCTGTPQGAGVSTTLDSLDPQ